MPGDGLADVAREAELVRLQLKFRAKDLLVETVLAALLYDLRYGREIEPQREVEEYLRGR